MAISPETASNSGGWYEPIRSDATAGASPAGGSEAKTPPCLSRSRHQEPKGAAEPDCWCSWRQRFLR